MTGSPAKPVRRGLAARLAVSTIWLAALVGAVFLVVAGQAGGPGLSDSGFALILDGLAVAIIVYATVGAILTVRRPGNIVGLLLMAAAVVFVVTFLGFIVGALLAQSRGTHDPLAGLVALGGALGISPTLILAGPTLAIVFPDGRLPGPGFRLPVLAIAATTIVGTVLAGVAPGSVGNGLAVNPLGIESMRSISTLGGGLAASALPVSLLVALAGVAVRFRRARGVERQQLKWFITANVAVAVGLMLSFADNATEPTAFDVVAVCSLSLPPIAVGIAILRYRLYEIDRIISRTDSWAVVTALLVGIFAGGLVALQGLLAGVTQGQTLAVAASTLVAFRPVPADPPLRAARGRSPLRPSAV